MRTTTPPRPRSGGRSFVRSLLRGLSGAWAAICTCIVVAVASLLIAWHGFGLVPIAVRSGSMSPAIPVHTLAFVSAVEPADVRVGDVITFDPPGPQPRTTHRVVERTKRGEQWYFRTKGDANDEPDDWRRGQRDPSAYERGITYGTRDAVRYRFGVPHAGRIADLGLGTDVRRALVVVGFVALAAGALRLIWRVGPEPRDVTDRDEESWEDDEWWAAA